MQMESIFQSLRNLVNWQRMPAQSIQFNELEKEIRIVIGYAVFYILSAYLIGLLITYYPIPILGATQFNQDFWYSIVFKIFLLLILPSLLYFAVWGYRIKDLLLGIKPTLINILATILLLSIGFFLNASHIKGIQENMNNFDDKWIRLTVGIIMPLFTAALPEELYFRGYLQTRLEKKWNRFTAILISTTLFTAWHLPSRYLLSQGIEGQAGSWGQAIIHTGIPVFIIGLLLATHWSRYRNIVLLIFTHWAIDILPSVSSYFKIPF
jgi:uncharacterized protein